MEVFLCDRVFNGLYSLKSSNLEYLKQSEKCGAESCEIKT